MLYGREPIKIRQKNGGNFMVMTNPCNNFIAYSTINAGLGAAGAYFFTAIHPGLGAVFGAVNGVAQVITLLALASFCPEIAKNPGCAVITAFVISCGVTMALAALVFTMAGVAFNLAGLAVLLVSFLAASIIVNVIIGCCCPRECRV